MACPPVFADSSTTPPALRPMSSARAGTAARVRTASAAPASALCCLVMSISLLRRRGTVGAAPSEQIPEEMLDPVEQVLGRGADVAGEVLRATRDAVGDSVEEAPRIDVVGCDHAERHLAGRTVCVVDQAVATRDPRDVDGRDRVPEFLVDRCDERIG